MIKRLSYTMGWDGRTVEIKFKLHNGWKRVRDKVKLQKVAWDGRESEIK